MYDDHVSLYYYYKAWRRLTNRKLICLQKAMTKSYSTLDMSTHTYKKFYTIRRAIDKLNPVCSGRKLNARRKRRAKHWTRLMQNFMEQINTETQIVLIAKDDLLVHHVVRN